MKRLTLKTYSKARLVEYYQKPLYYNKMLEEAKFDQRLAEAAQAYFMTLHEYEKANSFSFKTKQTFNDYEDFANSKQKYVWQYNEKISLPIRFKKIAIKEVNQALKEQGKSYYWLAKRLDVCQSNVDEFLKKEKLDKLSTDKVHKMYKLLNIK